MAPSRDIAAQCTAGQWTSPSVVAGSDVGRSHGDRQARRAGSTPLPVVLEARLWRDDAEDIRDLRLWAGHGTGISRGPPPASPADRAGWSHPGSSWSPPWCKSSWSPAWRARAAPALSSKLRFDCRAIDHPDVRCPAGDLATPHLPRGPPPSKRCVAMHCRRV